MQKPFELVVLGTSSATPTRERNPSGQYVRLDKHFFLIDCGEGTQSQINHYQLKLLKLKYVMISHLHGDHYFGLPGLITSMGLFQRTDPLTIIGPAALQDILKPILSEGNAHLNFEINFIVTNPEKHETVLVHDDFEIETVPLKHRIPCTGFVLREKGPTRKIDVDACQKHEVPISFYEQLKYGADWKSISNKELTFPAAPLRSYAYMSDTIYDEGIVEFIHGVDLLYHESTFLHDRLERAKETFHSTAKQAGCIARLAKAQKLMLGHYSARYRELDELLEEAQLEHPQVILGKEGLCIGIESNIEELLASK